MFSIRNPGRAAKSARKRWIEVERYLADLLVTSALAGVAVAPPPAWQLLKEVDQKLFWLQSRLPSSGGRFPC